MNKNLKYYIKLKLAELFVAINNHFVKSYIYKNLSWLCS